MFVRAALPSFLVESMRTKCIVCCVGVGRLRKGVVVKGDGDGCAKVSRTSLESRLLFQVYVHTSSAWLADRSYFVSAHPTLVVSFSFSFSSTLLERVN